jgi:hypothetical protein
MPTIGAEARARRYAVKLEELGQTEDGEGAAPQLTVGA